MTYTTDTHHIWHPYTSLPAKYPHYRVTDANGVYLTIEGKQVVDGMSSWWSAIWGYKHPTLNTAMHEQIDKFSHVMFGGLTHDPAIHLTELLTSLTPYGLDKVFYADSGSVSVEVALKMALQYQESIGRKRTKFVTFKGGYHGDTFMAMSVCDPQKGMHQRFKGVLSEQIFVSRPTLTNSKQMIQELEEVFATQHDIAGCIVEPIVQGAGGMNFYHPETLTKAKQLCEEYDVLFIADEIATGFGRSGKLFAVEYAEIVPDILCVGKALTGGMMSLAATITSHKVSERISVLMHGPTFMANPLACSAAYASLTLLTQSDWQSNIKRIETVLNKELHTITEQSVKDIRVLGAIGVVEFHAPLDMKATQEILLEHGVWLRPFGTLLYMMPPYIISDTELVTLCNAIKQVACAQ